MYEQISGSAHTILCTSLATLAAYIHFSPNWTLVQTGMSQQLLEKLPWKIAMKYVMTLVSTITFL